MAATAIRREHPVGGGITTYSGTLVAGTETTISDFSIIDGVIVSYNTTALGDSRLAATVTAATRTIVVTDATVDNAALTYTMIVFGKY
jgi:hypothetical protein